MMNLAFLTISFRGVVDNNECMDHNNIYNILRYISWYDDATIVSASVSSSSSFLLLRHDDNTPLLFRCRCRCRRCRCNNKSKDDNGGEATKAETTIYVGNAIGEVAVIVLYVILVHTFRSYDEKDNRSSLNVVLYIASISSILVVVVAEGLLLTLQTPSTHKLLYSVENPPPYWLAALCSDCVGLHFRFV